MLQFVIRWHPNKATNEVYSDCDPMRNGWALPVGQNSIHVVEYRKVLCIICTPKRCVNLSFFFFLFKPCFYA